MEFHTLSYKEAEFQKYVHNNGNAVKIAVKDSNYGHTIPEDEFCLAGYAKGGGDPVLVESIEDRERVAAPIARAVMQAAIS